MEIIQTKQKDGTNMCLKWQKPSTWAIRIVMSGSGFSTERLNFSNIFLPSTDILQIKGQSSYSTESSFRRSFTQWNFGTRVLERNLLSLCKLTCEWRHSSISTEISPVGNCDRRGSARTQPDAPKQHTAESKIYCCRVAVEGSNGCVRCVATARTLQ